MVHISSVCSTPFPIAPHERGKNSHIRDGMYDNSMSKQAVEA
jgi:hypothetical protein